MQIKEAIAQLVGLYIQQQAIDELIKDIKGELKEAGFNAAVVAAVAKAIANGKESELAEKSQEILDTVEISKS